MHEGIDYLRLECSRCHGSMLVSMCGRYRSCVCARCIHACVGSNLVDQWVRTPAPLVPPRAKRAHPKPKRAAAPTTSVGETLGLFGR